MRTFDSILVQLGQECYGLNSFTQTLRERKREWKEGGDVQRSSDLKHADIKARSRWLNKEIYWHSLGSNTSCINSRTPEGLKESRSVGKSDKLKLSYLLMSLGKTSYLATPICILYVYIWVWPICKLILHFTCLHGDAVLKLFNKEFGEGGGADRRCS